MIYYRILFSVLITFLLSPGLVAKAPEENTPLPVGTGNRIAWKDTLSQNQNLYNGRIWKNHYYNVDGDQFLFSNGFLQGSLGIRGKNTDNIKLLYDICNDEILTPLPSGEILQLNKEMVDSFSLIFQDRKYRFVKLEEDSLQIYVNVIYQDKSSLYTRYFKKIGKLASEGKYDQFYQVTQTYIVYCDTVYPVGGKKDLLKILGKEREMVISYMKENRIKISKNDPATLIPVIRYLDSLR